MYRIYIALIEMVADAFDEWLDNAEFEDMEN